MSHPKCVFCPENGFVEIIDETDDWYLVFVIYQGERRDDAILAIPKVHSIEMEDLPIEWGAHLTELKHLASHWIRIDQVNINLTRPSRTQDHFHVWFIQQGPGDPNKGLYSILCDHREAQAGKTTLVALGSTH